MEAEGQNVNQFESIFITSEQLQGALYTDMQSPWVPLPVMTREHKAQHCHLGWSGHSQVCMITNKQSMKV